MAFHCKKKQCLAISFDNFGKELFYKVSSFHDKNTMSPGNKTLTHINKVRTLFCSIQTQLSCLRKKLSCFSFLVRSVFIQTFGYILRQKKSFLYPNVSLCPCKDLTWRSKPLNFSIAHCTILRGYLLAPQHLSLHTVASACTN